MSANKGAAGSDQKNKRTVRIVPGHISTPEETVAGFKPSFSPTMRTFYGTWLGPRVGDRFLEGRLWVSGKLAQWAWDADAWGCPGSRIRSETDLMALTECSPPRTRSIAHQHRRT